MTLSFVQVVGCIFGAVGLVGWLSYASQGLEVQPLSYREFSK